MLDSGAPSSAADHLVIASHLGATASLFFAGSCLLAFGALVGRVLWTASRHRRMALVAAAAFRPDAPYVAGPIVLHGRVEKSEGAKHAARIEVVQEGTEEENSGVWSYKWTETSRRVLVEPFYVVDAVGRRTRVEPRDDVLLVDAMDRKASGKSRRRICSAELRKGEEVWASGELVSAVDPESPGGGYRGGAGLVLRAPPGQRMLLSSEPLGARFEAKARFHVRAALFLALAAVISCSLCFGSYGVRLFAGETRASTITKLEEYVVDTDNGSTKYFGVAVTLRDERATLRGDVPEGTFKKLREGEAIPVRWVRAIPRLSTLGADATENGFLVLVALFGCWLPSMLLYWSQIRRSLAWYETTLNETGKGKLADSK